MKVGIHKLMGMAVVLILILSSCDDPFGNKDDDDGGTPVRTINWEVDGNGYLQFSTNDADDLGYSIARYYGNTPITSEENVTIEVKKNSGSTTPGGVYLCKTETATAMVLIDNDGWFNVFDRIGDDRSEPIPDENTNWIGENVDENGWVESSAINGMGEFNTVVIELTEDGASHDFKLTINGVSQGMFSLTDSRTDGDTGFVAVIGTEEAEDFPETPADFRFRMTSPSIIPSGASSLGLSGNTAGLHAEKTEYRESTWEVLR